MAVFFLTVKTHYASFFIHSSSATRLHSALPCSTWHKTCRVSIDSRRYGLKPHVQAHLQSKTHRHISCPLKTVRLRSPDHPPVHILRDMVSIVANLHHGFWFCACGHH
ncbi:hypothetical protein ILYODFUR_025744 [Ilyodon furcidens]|uniref:Secreted protein n=1 Tax=Ilyodon furcidens TaxID=33524 RepID=A0ABV0UN43_9TELE